MTEFSKTIPILRSFDEAKAKEFYVGFLGFTVDWEHRFAPDLPLYMQVSRAGLSLHVSEHYGDATPGSAVFVETIGLRAFHAELIGKKYRNLRPGIEDAPWNAWLMTVIDPFGNSIRFSERKPE
ncbi:glyoxalase superfamily protein [Mesorhizobium sp. LHD-90]|uniref:glyoxalase superfamily protein n=1 Tax=Mesorhizobium sp. LHD-90 TaxID=3071414 RepID=UPI0027DF6580|nr:glyoxalase superfamily protein [Mesorhizobium sp. LHD-90]MDQ6434012.1 glyoxalase superfamily protein [Mesorhizobium sp. LHD-90]